MICQNWCRLIDDDTEGVDGESDEGIEDEYEGECEDMGDGDDDNKDNDEDEHNMEAEFFHDQNEDLDKNRFSVEERTTLSKLLWKKKKSVHSMFLLKRARPCRIRLLNEPTVLGHVRKCIRSAK